MKLLIVDDSVVMRHMIENDLQDLDLEIVGTAANGREAIKMFKQHLPDIVTLDITMPEIDGIECLKAMLDMNPMTNIIMVTALSDKATVLNALKIGAKSYIIKPFKKAKIKETLLKVLGVEQE